MTDTISPEVVDVPALRARLTEVEQLLQRHVQDLQTIAEAIREEAESREWCSDYGQFVRRINARTHEEWLQECMRSTVVLFRVTIQGSGTADEMAEFTDTVRGYLHNLQDEDCVDEVGVEYLG